MASVCRGSGAVRYSWSAYTEAGQALELPAPAAASKELALNVDALRKSGFAAGAAYNFTLTAWFEMTGGVAGPTSSDSLRLLAARTDLAAQIRGFSGDVPSSLLLALSAEVADADEPGGAIVGAAYAWACVRPALGGTACGVPPPPLDSSKWSIEAAALTLNQAHLITVTVSAGGRAATASTTITPREAGTPSGEQRSAR